MLKVILKDVAKKSGVSIKTASRVMNNLPYVSDATREKVFQAVEKLGYKPSLEGRRLANLKNRVKSSTGNIGCVLSSEFNKYSEPFFAELLEEIDRCLIEQNLHNYFCYTLNELEDRALFYRVMNPDVVDGILLIGTGEQKKISWIRKRINNLVIISDYLLDGSLSSVYPDGFEAGYQDTKYLISLGHRKIACITGYLNLPDNSYSNLRFKGYMKALKECRIKFGDGDIVIKKIKAPGGISTRGLKKIGFLSIIHFPERTLVGWQILLQLPDLTLSLRKVVVLLYEKD